MRPRRGTFNEAIEEGRVTEGRAIGFMCECGSLGCGTVIELSLAEYEDVRSDPRQFLVAPGHEDQADAVVVAIEGRFTVVVTRGAAAALAERTDPRAEGPVVQLIWGAGRRLSLISIDVEATAESVGVIRGWLVGFAAEHGADADLQGRVRIAVTEAMSNSVRHAYPSDQSGMVHVAADIEDDDLEVVVADDGLGFHAGATTGLGAGLQLIAHTATGSRSASGDRTAPRCGCGLRSALGSREGAAAATEGPTRAGRCGNRAVWLRRTSLGTEEQRCERLA